MIEILFNPTAPDAAKMMRQVEQDLGGMVRDLLTSQDIGLGFGIEQQKNSVIATSMHNPKNKSKVQADETALLEAAKAAFAELPVQVMRTNGKAAGVGV